MKVLLVHIAGRRAWPARRGLAVKVTDLIHATVLMFVVGIIKYAERTYSLYSGSVDGFRNKILDPPEPGTNYAKLMTEFDSKKKAGLVVEIDIANGQAEQAHKEMEKQETTRTCTAGSSAVASSSSTSPATRSCPSTSASRTRCCWAGWRSTRRRCS
jgi:hypothetical protein